MSTTLKEEFEIYIDAVAAFDRQDYEIALQQFQLIADTSSKIRFNIAHTCATVGRHSEAIEQYQLALRTDRYLAIAYFQQGASSFMIGNFRDAKEQFDDAFLYLRGNDKIDYEQLGLAYQLYSCEVLFNRGLCSLYLNDPAGLQDMQEASKKKKTAEHAIIDKAVRRKGKGSRLFCLPSGILYRPNASKVRNLAARDYLGKARLVATSDSSDVGTGFSGYERLKNFTLGTDSIGATPTVPIGTPDNALAGLSTKLELANIRLDMERELEFTRLDLALERKASTSATRSRFPLPTRSKTVVSRSSEKRIMSPNMSPRTSRISSRSISSSGGSSIVSDWQKVSVGPQRSLSTASSGRSVTESRSQRSSPSQPRVVLANSDASSFSQTLLRLQEELPIPDNSMTSSNSSFSNDSLLAAEDKLEFENNLDLLQDYYLPKTPASANMKSTKIQLPAIQESDAVRIRVKVYGLEDTRQIMIDSRISLEVFKARLAKKFDWESVPKLRSKDEDDELILLQDQEDLDECCSAAICAAQQNGRSVAKLELWVK